jgi:hypothetical protein
MVSHGPLYKIMSKTIIHDSILTGYLLILE